MSDRSYWMQAKWNGRPETPQQLGDRLIRTVDALQSLHPLLTPWDWGDLSEMMESEGDSGTYPFSKIATNIVRAIERNVSTDDSGDADPSSGYWMPVVIDKTASNSSVFLGVSAGRDGPEGLDDRLSFDYAEFEIGLEPNPSLMAYDLWRRMMLILVETWNATWAEASPDDINSEWTSRIFRCAWMNYVSPRYAPLITPPPSAIVEVRPNGGLFLAATDETFKTTNPKHMAVARDIETALLPLERLAYERDTPHR